MDDGTTGRVAACDVLVVGSGIAGVAAAIEAAHAGARVTLACAGRLFSGSSFYPGTWGLGLIGPRDEEDADDLARTICEVGCGMADPALVRTLVAGILPGIAWLEGLGVELRRPESEESAREAAFIPCFDHHVRLWRGLERASMERAFRAELQRLGVRVRERCELLDVIEGDAPAAGCPPRVAGALLHDMVAGRLSTLRCGAVVLAAGGTSGLLPQRLTSGDVLGSAHGIALAHGCSAVNVEFMQMMPGLVAPKRGLVFNEKTFRYLDEAGFAETGLPVGEPLRALLEQRSGHGPFTARLEDRAIDLAIAAAGPHGLAARYRFPGHEVPEFVRTFAAWLEGEQGIARDAELHVALYAHASNGGIRIDSDGRTELPGLFAGGEVAGGMHGADRLGGLSSANGLVFGRRAGRAAGAWAAAVGADGVALPEIPELLRGVVPCASAEADKLLHELRTAMGTACLVNRNECGLKEAQAVLQGLAAGLREAGNGRTDSRYACRDAGSGVARAMRLRAQLLTAQAMVCAMRSRRESRGAHHRSDFSLQDAAFDAPRDVRLAGNAVHSAPIGSDAPRSWASTENLQPWGA